MSILTLITRSLTHYRWLNLSVLVGVALTSAILSGALVVGDSVKESLRRNAEARILNAGPVLVGGDRFFEASLAERVQAKFSEGEGGPVVAPILQVQGTVSTQGAGKRLNGVQVIGVTDDFWKLGRTGEQPADLPDANWIAINGPLASRLNIGTEGRIVVRVEVPGALSRDAPLSGETEQIEPVAGGVDAVIDADHFGRFSLRAEQIPPATVFLPIATLQNALEKSGKANVLLVESSTSADAIALEKAAAELWTLADAGLVIEALPDSGRQQLISDRVFLDEKTIMAVREFVGQSDLVLSYLVNAVRLGDKLTPYSFAAGATSESNDLIPDDFGDDEVIVNQWLADDLGAKAGDRVTLDYFVFGEGRNLAEQSRDFTVRAILPMDTAGWDRHWTPEFPGISEVDSLDLWEPGIPIDKDRILPKDDKYWDDYEATPKAFVSYPAARQMWENRFGQATAIRLSASIGVASLEAGLRERLILGDLGLTVRDLQAEAEAAVGQSFDFGALFAAMSFFLIIAALILTGLVFVFGIEQRAGQIGLLMALGMPGGKVRRLFLIEALILSMIGAGLGLVGGWVYTKLALLGMSGAWQAAAAGIEFVYYVRAVSLGIAFGTTVFLALIVVFFASRLVTKVQPSHLIAGGDAIGRGPGEVQPLVKSWSFWIGIISLMGGAGCLLAPKEPGTMAEQGLFFGAGFLITAAGVSACALGLRFLVRPGESLRSLGSLSRQNAVRRKGRSLAVIGLMAAGVFMVTAINSFRLEGKRGADRRTSGTGGFAYVGESTVPIYEDMNAELGRQKYQISDVAADPESWEMIQFRVSDGDDASCLNLNRAQRPRLLGVDWVKLTNGLDPFGFMKNLGGETYERWFSLSHNFEPTAEGVPVIPGVIDMNTATYALQKGLGDVIEYESPSGDRFDVRLTGLLETSILQGNIIIDEDEFIRHFPDSGGYRFFLLEAPEAEAEKLATHLTRMLGDRGLEMLPAWERLNEFNAVQNTYLSIFSTLGGLGILLGTIGLAVVVGRNVLERKGQLGLMQAVGFTRQSLGRMVLSEHWFLHVLGVVLGIVAAIIAVAPKVLSRAGDLPAGLLIGINGSILVGGLIFCWVAARSVLRGSLMDALRSE